MITVGTSANSLTTNIPAIAGHLIIVCHILIFIATFLLATLHAMIATVIMTLAVPTKDL